MEELVTCWSWCEFYLKFYTILNRVNICEGRVYFFLKNVVSFYEKIMR